MVILALTSSPPPVSLTASRSLCTQPRDLSGAFPWKSIIRRCRVAAPRFLSCTVEPIQPVEVPRALPIRLNQLVVVFQLFFFLQIKVFWV